jgi:predicted 3-demethylubiquinone-9 3-methyltransferase (glyoxalase superfamily)
MPVVRLAQGHVRRFMASRSQGPGRDDPRPRGKGRRVMQAMLQMKKIDIKALQQAASA